MQQDTLYSIIGWVGFAFIMGAYIAVVIGWLKPESKTYPLMGVIGAICGFATSMYLDSMEAVRINAIWLIISSMAIFSIPLPKIISCMKGFWAGYLLLLSALIITFVNNKSLAYEDIFSIAASMASYTFLASYFLFTQLKINQKTFYLLSLKGQLMFIPILFIDNHYSMLLMQLCGGFFSILGLIKLNINFLTTKFKLMIASFR